jgi:uncharacterized protein YkwD
VQATDPVKIYAGTSPNNATSALLPWLHKGYRSRHQKTPPLSWNATLASQSQAWANG